MKINSFSYVLLLDRRRNWRFRRIICYSFNRPGRDGRVPTGGRE